jgi:arylsulfatase A
MMKFKLTFYMMKFRLTLSVLILGSVSLYAQAQKSPNVILILSDDQGWGATSVQMDANDPLTKSDFMQTPNLERLAERGVRFTNGYTSHPNCSPSRASIQTGKTPARLHFTDILGRIGGSTNPGYKLITPRHINGLPETETTIAEIIKQNRPEYATAYFGKWHQDKKGPASHGYDVSDGPTGNGEGNRKMEGNPKDIFGITSRSCAFMETQVAAKKPFFMQVSHYAVHMAIQSRAETKEKYKNLKPGKRHNNVDYAAMTDDMDTGIGILLDKVKSLGIEDNTYIIFLADNGAFPGLNPGNTNGQIRGWKATVWEGGIRTPFIVAGPNIPENKFSKVRVVGWDIFPTICEWLNIKKLPDNLDGGSFAKVVANGGTGEVMRVNDFLIFHWPHYVPGKDSYPSTAIIKDSMKLFVSYETGEKWLFNIETDRAETTPLNDKYPAKVKELLGLMNGYLKSVDAGMPKENPNFIPEKNVMLIENQKNMESSE